MNPLHQRGDLMPNGKPRSEAAAVRRKAIRRARERALNRVARAHRAEYRRYINQEMAAEGITTRHAEGQ